SFAAGPAFGLLGWRGPRAASFAAPAALSSSATGSVLGSTLPFGAALSAISGLFATAGAAAVGASTAGRCAVSRARAGRRKKIPAAAAAAPPSTNAMRTPRPDCFFVLSAAAEAVAFVDVALGAWGTEAGADDAGGTDGIGWLGRATSG